MLLKKQTVWLLTMLSLVVVLSVYYVTLDPAKSDLAATEEKGSETPAAGKGGENGAKVVTEAAGDEAFETMRLTIQDKRSKQKADMTAQVASPELTADEKDKLYTEMQALDDLTLKEQALESQIIALGYSDALVRTEGSQVMITIKHDEEHSRAEAAEIIKMAREEIGTNMIPAVEFQAGEKADLGEK